MDFNVSAFAALSAGVLSFFTPCLLPMVPIYLFYLTGSSDEDELIKNKTLVLKKSILFVVGFTMIFMAFGVGASFLGGFFASHKFLFQKISGFIIILFGLYMTGLIKINLKSINFKAPKNTASNLGAILMGIAFGGGFSPCYGPILGAILTMASGFSIKRGVILLFIYSLGMAIPFLLSALLIDKFNRLILKFNSLDKLKIIIGIFIICFGLYIFLK